MLDYSASWKQGEGKQFLLLDKNSFATSHSKTFLWTPIMTNFSNAILQNQSLEGTLW